MPKFKYVAFIPVYKPRKLSKRNQLLLKDLKLRKYMLKKLALKYGITKQRISQIYHRHTGEAYIRK